MRSRLAALLFVGLTTLASCDAHAETSVASVSSLESGIREQMRALSSAPGPRLSFERLSHTHGLPASAYADFVVVRTLFEATRDAGFWNLGWTITNREPASDAIWSQWAKVTQPSTLRPTAYAECDELSALFALLVRRLGVRGVGLFWPASNHTVAVWSTPGIQRPVRLVVPTTQIFLSSADMLGTVQFDPWRQKAIYEYSRSDIAPSSPLPDSLVGFFLRQMQHYASATDETLQYIRYLRDGVFNAQFRAGQAALLARQRSKQVVGEVDRLALEQFAKDMEARP